MGPPSGRPEGPGAPRNVLSLIIPCSRAPGWLSCLSIRLSISRSSSQGYEFKAQVGLQAGNRAYLKKRSLFQPIIYKNASSWYIIPRKKTSPDHGALTSQCVGTGTSVTMGCPTPGQCSLESWGPTPEGEAACTQKEVKNHTFTKYLLSVLCYWEERSCLGKNSAEGKTSTAELHSKGGA